MYSSSFHIFVSIEEEGEDMCLALDPVPLLIFCLFSSSAASSLYAVVVSRSRLSISFLPHLPPSVRPRLGLVLLNVLSSKRVNIQYLSIYLVRAKYSSLPHSLQFTPLTINMGACSHGVQSARAAFPYSADTVDTGNGQALFSSSLLSEVTAAMMSG